MPTKKKASKTKSAALQPLKGWRDIAAFLGEPLSVVQRWAREGMPIVKEGRSVTADRAQLGSWMGKVSGKPVHVASEDDDLAAELKRGLTFVRQKSRK